MQDQAADHKFTKEDEENPFLKPAIDATRGISTPRDDEGLVQNEDDSQELSIDQDG